MSVGKLRYAKSKGRAAEATVVAYLRDQGFNAERRRLTGCEDCGDVSGIQPGCVVEVKDEKRINLAGYMDELAHEIINATGRLNGEHTGFAVLKRKGHPTDPAMWYAVMELEQMVALLKKAGYR